MRKSETITEYAKAFIKAQKEVKQPLKDKDNPFFKSKYVPLESVADTIVAAFGSNGLAYSQDPQVDDNGNIAVTTLVMHESGEWIEYGPTTLKPVKNDPQAAGSAITYARRYALSAIFGITSDEDDDGNNATHPKQQKTQTQPQQPKPQPQAPKPIGEKVTKEVAEKYKAAVIEYAGRRNITDGSVTKQFLERLGVANYNQITVNQIEYADEMVAKMANDK